MRPSFKGGLLLGLALTVLGFFTAGAGHGTLVPLLLIQGPLALLRPLADISARVHNIAAPLALIATPVLYGLYGVFLRRADGTPKRAGLLIAGHLICSFVSLWQLYTSM